MTNIRDTIVEKRRERIARLGHSEGAAVPLEREAPLVSFLPEIGMICEIKRSSPSKGVIAAGLDAVGQAAAYITAGVRNLSILTEPTGFSGSLDDLMAVKRAYPEVAVLRKDFLFDPEDIDIAWRAGADAGLLIAGMLTADRLADLYRRAKQYGMQALVELHDAEDVEKARLFRPGLVGVNSRDLTTFTIDPLLPLKVKSMIDWPTRVVYESGIHFPEQAAFAVSSGFCGILVGESVVRDPKLPARLADAMEQAKPIAFWPYIAKRLNILKGKPLVKICGLTNEDDVRQAAQAGADLLGFVFYEKSKRRADPALLRQLKDIKVPKIAVVVEKAGDEKLDPEILALLEEGALDAVQFHGDSIPEDCARLWPAYYKAVRPVSAEAVRELPVYRCPRLLLDAAAELPGGNGVCIADNILSAWKNPLWLAGGLTTENIGEAIRKYYPELVDCASGVESSAGIKDHTLVSEFIRKAHND